MELLVVSSYPEKGTTHSAKTVGVASYTKTLLHAIKKQDPSLSITVVAEQFQIGETYTEEGIHIQRMWKRNSLKSIWSLFRKLRQQKEKTILISFEIYMFGQVIPTIFALLHVCLLRLQGKKIIFVMHQVLADFQTLESNPLKIRVLNTAKRLFYYLVRTASTKIVVFEEQLKLQLAAQIPKVAVIPHFVYTPTTNLTKKDARKALQWSPDALYCLYFGYLAPYKGIDKLIRIWPDNTAIKLVIAGGANPNHVKNEKMQEFVKTVTKEADQKHIPITGFLPEEQVPLYFTAADCVILPYTTFMSSSGPLSLAFAYEKAVLLSPALSAYFKTSDLHQALSETSLTVSEMTLPLAQDVLEEKLTALPHILTALTSYSRIIKETRSLDHIAGLYVKLIETV
jgi:glycosyltransferase involved in cell wall biosynthesis